MPKHSRNLADILRLPTLGDAAAYVDLRTAGSPVVVTALELQALIEAFARGLVRRGIKVGERIGIVAENRLEFVVAYLGALWAGVVAVPVNHRLPVATVAHIFADSQIALAFVDAPRRVLVPPQIAVVDFDGGGERGFEGFLDRGAREVFRPGPDDLAEILYTSGSTGRPKGVPLTHHGQFWALENYFEPLVVDDESRRTLIVAPLYHMNGLFFTTVALSNRITVYSLPRFDARRYLEAVARCRCTILSGIPTMFAMMVRERDLIASLDLGFVREVSIGSAPLTDALLEQVGLLFPNAEIHNGFGTTEAGPAVFGPHPAGTATPPLSLGYPMSSIEWALVDGPSANEGVLALRTPALTRGYLNLPEVTAQKMRDGWYLTGDVMRRDEQGFFYFVGRADDMFVCGGENLYPGEIEKMLEHHPAVGQAIVVPATDDIKGQIPVAFIVPRPGERPEPEDVKRYALANGPAYAHPRLVVIRDQLPLSGTHKFDRAALTAEAESLARAAGRATGVAP